MVVKKTYCLGFAFSSRDENGMVVLIQKAKPEWQAGKLNGVGGKVEEGENPAEAMQREFLEETGVTTQTHEWDCFGVMNFNECDVFLFTMILGEHHAAPKTMTIEPVRTYPIRFVGNSADVVPNLRYLVNLAFQVAIHPDGMNLNANFDFREFED